MAKKDLIEEAAALLTAAVATQIAGAYTDNAVFPQEVVIDGPTAENTSFPGWSGEVLVLAHENQGVCAWGLALDGEGAGAVVVGGDLFVGETTVVYAASLQDYVNARLWDRECLEQEPLLQAQAGPADQDALDVVSGLGRAVIVTQGWPCAVNRRFEVGDVRIMMWADTKCCDWWISGPNDAVRRLLPALVLVSNLREALWSNDKSGIRLLDELELRR